jgi:hypothetical protein
MPDLSGSALKPLPFSLFSQHEALILLSSS